MRYEDFVSEHVALRQAAYDVNYKVWRLRQDGWKYKDIAKLLGISCGRAQQRFNSFKPGQLSPIEIYLKEHSDIAELAFMRPWTPKMKSRVRTLDLRNLST